MIKKLKYILIACFSIMLLFIVATSIYIYYQIIDIKNIDVTISNNVSYSILYDSNNNKIDLDKNYNYNYVTIDKLKPYTIGAFLSIEDKNFYEHNGLNYKRIVKAIYNNITSLSFKEGASTISQQYIKNKFLSSDKTISRKIKEIYLTKKLEKINTKDQILEAYLNTIYYGNGAYGIGNACNIYFNKNIEDISISESATLAGIIKSPLNYNPLLNYEKCISRRNLVLSEMKKDNVISNEEYTTAVSDNLDIVKNNTTITSIDKYTDFALFEASNILNMPIEQVLTSGYSISTYKNDIYQNILNSKLFSYKDVDINQYSNNSDKLAIIQDKLGNVLAVSGISEYNLVNLNRQPGSTIKPVLVYAPALEYGKIHIDSHILDEEINYNGYMPKNIGDKYYGYISVKDAVAKSLNIPAIKVMSSVGIEKCKEFGRTLGIKFDSNDTGYSLALGGFTSGITLDELVNSYTPFINDGKYNKYAYIKEIRDKNNNITYSRNYNDTQVMGDDTTYLMNNVLKYSVKNGTSKNLSSLNYDIAGKTGTVASNDGIRNTDVYSLAYTSEIIMGVWFGNYSMDEEYHLDASNNGGTYATNLIKDTFNEIYKTTTPPPFSVSPNVVELDINKNILNNNHIIELASNDTQDIYKIKALFSDRFKPSIDKLSISNNIIMPKLNITTNKNSINISFDTVEYQRYKLYEINNNITALVLDIANSKDIVYYTKQNINNNEKYTYYIEVENIFTDKKQTTKEIDVLIDYNYNAFDKIINNEYNESLWYFR